MWAIGLGLILLLNLLGVARWHYDDGLQESFENHDTRIILKRLQQPHSIWAWFVGDWVLGNGFYRPLPSMLYQVDYWLWGDDLLRWKWTNGLLATASALALVGLVYTLTGRRSVALAAGLAFTLWQTGFAPTIPLWVGFGALAAGVAFGYWQGDWRRGGADAERCLRQKRIVPECREVDRPGIVEHHPELAAAAKHGNACPSALLILCAPVWHRSSRLM